MQQQCNFCTFRCDNAQNTFIEELCHDSLLIALALALERCSDPRHHWIFGFCALLYTLQQRMPKIYSQVCSFPKICRAICLEGNMKTSVTSKLLSKCLFSDSKEDANLLQIFVIC